MKSVYKNGIMFCLLFSPLALANEKLICNKPQFEEGGYSVKCEYNGTSIKDAYFSYRLISRWFALPVDLPNKNYEKELDDRTLKIKWTGNAELLVEEEDEFGVEAVVFIKQKSKIIIEAGAWN